MTRPAALLLLLAAVLLLRRRRVLTTPDGTRVRLASTLSRVYWTVRYRIEEVLS